MRYTIAVRLAPGAGVVGIPPAHNVSVINAIT
jgi:hypothetical protein